MTLKRPKIKIPMDGLDIVLELSSFTILLLLFVYTIMTYSELSEQIPVHYSASGTADDYGNKNNIWVLPSIGLVISIGMFILNRFPHIHNYNTTITENNAQKYYRFSTRLVRFSLLFVMVVFGVIQYTTIQKGLGNPTTLSKTLMPFIVFSGISFAIITVLYKNKLKNS